MLVNVTKPFPYSNDGIRVLQATVGECEIPDSAVPGLIAEGFVDGEGHPEVAMAASRRLGMTDRLTTAFRAHLDASPDALILDMIESLDEQERRAAPAAPETKVEPPLETGEPEPIEIDAQEAALEQVDEPSSTEASAASITGQGPLEPAEPVIEPEPIIEAPQPAPESVVEAFSAWAEPTPEVVEETPAAESVVEVVEQPAPLVEIPADWSALHWKQKVALAKAISGNDVETADAATAIITAEVERRAAPTDAA